MSEAVAIVGMSCLFPGARTVDQFWQQLLAERDCTSQATADDLGIAPDLVYHPQKGRQDRTYCLRGGFVRDFTFDPAGYRLPASTLPGPDHPVSWSLYTGRQALLDASLWPDRDLDRCGLVLGNLSFPTRDSHRRHAPIYASAVEAGLREALGRPDLRLPGAGLADLRAPGGTLGADHPAALVAAGLGLGGPAFCIDAACASSLYAVALACRYLWAGKADLMLAGAVSCADPLFITLGFSIFQAYPANGESRPLDRGSQGLIAGEGAGMFVLKRHGDALRDGDRVLAVIRGCGLSNDGSGAHPLRPNARGQVLAFERAYAAAGIDPGSIHYVECHATGTPAGDVVELNSMEAFFGPHGAAPRLGAVKSSIGHLLTAAGMAGMIKTILALRHGWIPATIRVEQPLASQRGLFGPVQIATRPAAWPVGRSPRRAAVNAFGFGGANAHLLLEEPGAHLATSAAPVAPTTPLALTGMAACFGGCPDLAAFGQAIFDGRRLAAPLPRARWQGIEEQAELLRAHGLPDGHAPDGAYLDGFSLDFGRYRIPPHAGDRPVPQQLLLLKMADNALRDAGMARGGNVAVLVVMHPERAIHSYRGRIDLAWQLRAGLAAAGLALDEGEFSELEAIAKDAVMPAAAVNQYTSFIGNIMASRISSLWDFTGPALTITAGDGGVFRALELAAILLDAGEVDAVLLGAVDLAAGAEGVLARSAAYRASGSAGGWMPGEGGGAVVLQRADRARRDGRRIYATVDGLRLAGGGVTPIPIGEDLRLRSHCRDTPTAVGSTELRDAHRPQTIAAHEARGATEPTVVGVVPAIRPQSEAAPPQPEALWDALAMAGAGPADVGYVEVHGDPLSPAFRLAAALRSALMGGDTGDEAIRAGAAASCIGGAGAASGMAALIKVALCIYERFIPATPPLPGAPAPRYDRGSMSFSAMESRPWLLAGRDARRRTALIGVGQDGVAAAVILGEEPAPRPDVGEPLRAQLPLLLPIPGDSLGDLLDGLRRLEADLRGAASPQHLVARSLDAVARQPRPRYALALIGHDREGLLAEVAHASAGLERAFATGAEWHTPSGSYCTAAPLAPRGDVTFVYPGGTTSYPGLGRDLFRLFPSSLDRLERMSTDVGRLLGADWLYGHSPDALSPAAQRELVAGLAEEVDTAMASGTAFSYLHTAQLREIFRVEPAAAFGYSRGEAAMLWGLGVWALDGETPLRHISPALAAGMAGLKTYARDYWAALPGSEAFTWATLALRAPVERVREALRGEPLAHLSVINAPSDVFIVGEGASCRRVVERLGCAASPVLSNYVVHSPPAAAAFEEMVRLHTYPVAARPAMRFYSVATYAPLVLESEALAERIAKTMTGPVDFPRLVERVYGAGARIFVEVGPTSFCTHWIGDILAGRPHLAVAWDQPGMVPHAARVRALARLLSHGVPVDLSPLRPRLDAAGTPSPLVQYVALGGKRIREAVVKGVAVRPHIATRIRAGAQARADGGASGTYGRLGARASRPPGVPGEQFPALHLVAPDAAGETPVLPGQIRFAPDHNFQARPADESGSTMNRTPSPERQRPGTASARTPLPSLVPVPALRAHAAVVTAAHCALLAQRRTAQETLRELIARQMATASRLLQRPGGQTGEESAPGRPGAGAGQAQSSGAAPPVADHSAAAGPTRAARAVIWDDADLLEFAGGSIARVFGPAYAPIDAFSRRVRLPMPPYLLVSRVTALQAERGRFQPSAITTEYDIPAEAWYATDGQAPGAIAVESGQCDLLLISYLGIDFENRGNRVYRLLDCGLTFLAPLPTVGQTLRFNIRINSFARSGENLLFFFSYNCYVGETLVLAMDGGCAGFFADAELAQGRGVRTTDAEQAERARAVPRHITPPLRCEARRFDEEALRALSRGDLARAFGPAHAPAGRNPSLRLPPPAMVMLSRISSVDPRGGPWGLGAVEAEKDLRPDDWYFPCHFKDDPVLAGSLMAEGCVQLLQCYMLYLGLQQATRDARFQPITGHRQVVHCRGQVTPADALLTYRMEVTEIVLGPVPSAKANVDILVGDKTAVRFIGVGVQIVEKALAQSGEAHPGEASTPRFDERQIAAFATGSIVDCLGTDFRIYETRPRHPRIPNGDLALISRVAEVHGERHQLERGGSLVAEYDVPPDAWFFRESAAAPDLPYAILMELGLQPCGFLSAYLGTTLPYPDEDFYFRNLDGRGRLVARVDARGKMVRTRVRLLSSTAIQGVIIQKFAFALACEDTLFYEGDAVFGYFNRQALAGQRGLDGGAHAAPWLPAHPDAQVRRLDLRDAPTRDSLYTTNHGPHYRLMPGRLDLLDEVTVVPRGGRHGHGYLYAARQIRPEDWFFDAHFYQDSVMPGSLGVQAMVQALHAFALLEGIGREWQAPRFAHTLSSETVWKYRGQIPRGTAALSLEVHVRAVADGPGYRDIIGDASLWRDEVRIYEVRDLAIRVQEGRP